MPNFIEIQLEQKVLARYGSPDIAYPEFETDLHSALTEDGELPLTMMLHTL